MRRYQIILLSLLAFAMTSCRTIRVSSSVTEDVQTHVIQYPTVTDLTVLNKTEKTITWNFQLFKKDRLALIKANLQADMLKELDADILLEPQYTFKKVPFGERTLTITGYPAKFKDFRKATEEDIKALQAVYEKACEQCVYNVAKPSRREMKKEKKRFLGLF
ncbi:MAG: hypothetical protein IJK42_10790 [Prevotella sp.]|nr:hypothetical protein [Prevotella sp.]